MSEGQVEGIGEPKLVVGLGNPGAKYRETRHNIGFRCLDELHRRMGSPTPTSKFEGQIARGRNRYDRELSLVWPLTYMNASGRCVQPLAAFYKFSPSNILVICDDLALPLGKLRVRQKGSGGGQKGLEDILRALGTQDVPRLRIGIDPCPERWETSDYVLSRFRTDEIELVDTAVKRACDAVMDWTQFGLSYVMNQYNRNDH